VLLCFILAIRKPNPPTLLASTPTSITLEWEAISERTFPTYYIVSWEPATVGGRRSTRYNEKSVTIENLNSNTAYVFKIAAQNKYGKGEASDSATFQTG